MVRYQVSTRRHVGGFFCLMLNCFLTRIHGWYFTTLISVCSFVCGQILGFAYFMEWRNCVDSMLDFELFIVMVFLCFPLSFADFLLSVFIFSLLRNLKKDQLVIGFKGWQNIVF